MQCCQLLAFIMAKKIHGFVKWAIVKFAQCENNRVFQSFIVYVKSKLANVEVQNLPFSYI